MTHLYEFSQNNTGGSFVVDDKICHRIIIEAENESHAIEIAEDLGCYWDGCEKGMDCECCGDRWYRIPSEIDLKEINVHSEEKYFSIDEYLQYQADRWGWTAPDIRLFYLDGTVKEFYSKRLDKKK